MDETQSPTQDSAAGAPAPATTPMTAAAAEATAAPPASGSPGDGTGDGPGKDPGDGPSLERIAPRLVAWHNRHPLARRITAADVHTLGVVALPFMGAPRQEAREPSLDAPSAAPTSPSPAAATRRRFALPWAKRPVLGPRAVWDERFIAGASTRQIEAMALAQSFGEAPSDMPLRRIAIAPALAAGDANQSGAWPLELYLLSAAIDAGPARSRVLVGQLGKVLGRRCLDPRRLGLAAAAGLLLLALLGWALWPASPKTEAAPPAAAPAASAASATAAPLPASAASAALAADEAASAASAASAVPGTDAASAAPGEAASAAAAPASIALPFPLKRDQAPMQSGSAAAANTAASSAAGSAAASAASAKPGQEPQESRVSVDEVGLGKLRQMEPGTKVVALVSLPQKSKAEAEAQLARMRELLGQTLKGDAPLSGAVLQTKDGWRAAMWPFASREEAQLVNAMLIARGMRLRAVDF